VAISRTSSLKAGPGTAGDKGTTMSHCGPPGLWCQTTRLEKARTPAQMEIISGPGATPDPVLAPVSGKMPFARP